MSDMPNTAPWRGSWPFASAPATVLVVDDDPGVRRVSVRTLRYAGFEVIDAEDGVAALDVLSTHPDLAAIVTDVIMPRFSGDGLARQVWSRAPLVPILFVSAFPEHYAGGAVNGGRAAFLRKPFRPNELVAAVRALIAAV
jgi:CheY-like chemotaxis protein